MKTFILLASLFPLYLHAQNVGIGTAAPDASAVLHLNASNKGVLVPKIALVDAALQNPVASPATGLLLYNTTISATLSEGFYFWNGALWDKIASANSGAVPKNGIIEFENKATIPGYTYIGYENADYFTKIGEGSGSWNSIANNTSGNNARNASFTLYGGKIFVWSGEDNSYASYDQEGRVYNIAGNTWTPMSNTNVPAGRFGNVTVTDQANGYMFVWGGITGYTLAGTVPTVTNTGGIYDLLLNNTWYAMPTGPLAARMQHAGVWTGSKMIIWGGQNGAGTVFADGASYNIGTNTWTAIAPSPLAARYGHTATWTGSKMIVYGGTNGTTIFNDGAAYDPALNTWSLIAPNNIFTPSHSHTALWTGTEIIMFGGVNAFGSTASCVRYNVGTNTWSSAGPVPGESSAATTVTDHQAVWTGTEMIVAGGTNSFAFSTGVNLVRVYNPATNTWRMFNNLPQGKIGPVAVWTGSDFIVQGGSFFDVSGYKYNPAGGSTQDIEVSQSRAFYKYRKN